ncbi:MAG TPA: glycosyltransferase family 39 protein [Polyangiaceae bacterium]|nr:glycosyltransferase family 39 protein [Polyangiaceae bacterium]
MSGWRERFRAAPVAADGVWLALLALGLRLGVVAWAWQRFPPADDGSFYHKVADRIAHGLGYTWLWPDGAVTYAAHYPIGYPALIGLGYAFLGSHPEVAMLENAFLGALGVFAVHGLAARVGQRGPALLAGLIAALHPSVLFYTPALMTEGVTAAAFALLAWLSLEARKGGKGRIIALSVLAGVTVLIRPQALLLIPVFGAFASPAPGLARLRSAALVTALSVLVCLPWTLRNCQRLEHCTFVSANGGWNLFIGSADKATGTWVSIDELGVPVECRHVFGEVDKDQCFGRAGLRNVLSRPGHFVSLIPSKLAATFDWSGAPGHYLNASNGSAFDAEAALTLGMVELLVQRAVLSVGLVALGLGAGPRRRLRLSLAVLALVCLLGPALFARWWLVRSAWIAHLLLIPLLACFGKELFRRPNFAFAAAAVGATALTHALFFGAGRYGLVCVLLLVPLVAEVFRREPEPGF